MKNLIRLIILVIISGHHDSSAQSFAFTVNPQSLCLTWNTQGFAGVTTQAPGATNYTWSIASSTCNATFSASTSNGTFISIYYPCAGTYSVYGSAVNNTVSPPSVIASTMLVVTVNPSVGVYVSSPQTNICPGSSTTLTANGANTYTWQPGGATGSQVVVSPMASTMYTVYGTSTTGCTNYQYAYITVANPTSINVGVTNNQICSGSTFQAFASGAANYTFVPAPASLSGNGNVATYSPSASGCFTVYGSNGGTCTTVSNVQCYTVSGASSVSVTGNHTVCPGVGATLTASGANTYTWYSSMSTVIGSSAVLIPPSTGNYTYVVIGSSGAPAYCGSWYSGTITALGAPPLSVSVSPAATICPGATATIGVSGAMAYTWMPGNFTGSSIVVSPTATSSYTVLGGQSSGCNSYTTILISIAPGLSAYSSANNLCPGQSATLSTSAGWTSHLWTAPGGTISAAPTAVVNPTTATCYTVTAIHATYGCSSSKTVCIGLSALSFSFNTWPPTVCGGGSVTMSPFLFPTSAYSYTWQPGNLNTATVTVSPSVSTCYTLTVSHNTTGCTGTGVQCITVVPAPTLVVSGNQPVCAGSPVSMSVTGASSYSWNTGSTWVAGPVFSVIPAANQQTYGVVSFVNGCYFSVGGNFTVTTSPTVSIVGASSVCPGGAAVLYGFGASSYTWLPSLANGNSITVNPASATTYTLLGANGSGCSSSASKVVYMYPIPNVVISGNNNICLGGSTTLTASGASSYTWNTSQTSNPIVVTPLSNTCYSVMGTSANGCTAMAVSCVTVNSTSLVVSPSTPTVCKWSSVTLTVTGATSYTWSTSANTATVNVIPLTTTVYTVSGTGSNGCIGTATVAVVVDTTCSQVWPGDANSDGVVGSTDVLELGFAANATGAARSGASNNYVAQFANNWSGTVSSGKNRCHADCNGSGTVNAADTVAIFNNFSQTHSFRLAAGNGPADIYLVSNTFNLANPGWNSLDIMLGDSLSSIGLYGLVFDLGFDQSVIEAGEAYISYTPSFLNNGGANIEFRKPALNNGIIYAASVRTDQSDVNGYGKIGEFWFKVKEGLAESTVLPVGITNAMKAGADRSSAPLSGNTLVLALNSNPLGISEGSQAGSISAYPNPASGWLTLKSAGLQQVRYSITDITGRLIREGGFRGSVSIATEGIENGTYIITFKTKDKQQSQKLIIQN
jgi:hypothetical protein